jgi:hypothetical protein
MPSGSRPIGADSVDTITPGTVFRAVNNDRGDQAAIAIIVTAPIARALKSAPGFRRSTASNDRPTVPFEIQIGLFG